MFIYIYPCFPFTKLFIFEQCLVFIQVEYYLKWIGYDESDNTWEPVEHLECPELIQAYENAQKAKKDSKDDDVPEEADKEQSVSFH